jgi:hypothetical protein
MRLGYDYCARLPWNFGEHPEDHMCRAFGFSVILVALLCSPSGIGLAADDKTCQDYANAATSQQVKDAIETCGYSGDMWGTDRLNHFQWCTQNSAETVKAEADRRSEAVKKCDRCKVYGEEATSAQSENRPTDRHQPVVDGIKVPPMSCGYRGDAWSWDKKAHTRWCAAVSDDDAKRETDNRKRWLDICKTCRDFAHQAVVAYLKVWNNCKSFWSNEKMSRGDWSVDHRYHFGWCMGLSAEGRPTHTEAQRTRREQIVSLCQAKISQPLTIQPAAKAETRKRVPAAEPKRAATKPVGTARKPSADSDKAAATSKKVPSSGSSAMDRLGGSPSPSGTASGSAGGGSRRGPSAAQSSPSSGTETGGAAAPATSINRNAIGGGGGERIR